MFGLAVDKIERGRSSFENTGTRLENEFIGEVDATKYKERAYNFYTRKNFPRLRPLMKNLNGYLE